VGSPGNEVVKKDILDMSVPWKLVSSLPSFLNLYLTLGQGINYILTLGEGIPIYFTTLGTGSHEKPKLVLETLSTTPP
jgi:hypothetical protein